MCCQCLKKAASSGLLFLTNMVDGACGGGIFIYSCYLGTHGYAPPFMAYTLIGLGLYMLVAALLSWYAIAYARPRVLLCSAYSAVPIALTELSLATALLVKKDWIVSYLQRQAIDPARIAEVTQPALPIAMYAMFVCELLRYYASVYMRQSVGKAALKKSLMADEAQAQRHALEQERAQTRASKYGGLRDHYKEKYGMKTSRADSAIASQNAL